VRVETFLTVRPLRVAVVQRIRSGPSTSRDIARPGMKWSAVRWQVWQAKSSLPMWTSIRVPGKYMERSMSPCLTASPPPPLK
jgi:hypothetical protein